MTARTLILGILFVAYTTSATAQKINTENSKVSFSVAKMKAKTVEGTFTGMTGKVKMMRNKLSSINICIDPATVKTDKEKRDAHLKNEDFFEVETYKTICFVSTEITETETGIEAKGDLSMHGVTKEVTIPLIVNNNNIKGTFTVDRYDYLVGDDGEFNIGREVTLTIECELE